MQDPDHFKMTSDSIHLGQFMKIKHNESVLDIGTNNGVLLMMASQFSQNTLIGIDINEAALDLARQNATLNGLSNLDYIKSTVQNYRDRIFDVILCNPPYYKQASSVAKTQSNARFDLDLSYSDLFRSVFELLKDKGRLYIIIPIERLQEAFVLMEQYHLTAKRSCFIHHNRNHDAHAVLIEAHKFGLNHMIVEAPIFNKESS